MTNAPPAAQANDPPCTTDNNSAVGNGSRPINWKRLLVTTGVSAVLHLLLLAICASIIFDQEDREEIIALVSGFVGDRNEPLIEQLLPPPSQLLEAPLDARHQPLVVEQMTSAVGPVKLDVNDLPASLKLDEQMLQGLANINLSDETSGRSAAARAALVRKFGGTAASEAAVASGLVWLANHQLEDGSWSFDHAACPRCNGQCSQPGNMPECKIAATAFALLAYLGAGHTPDTGDYQPQVRRGLEALLKRGVLTKQGALDLRGEMADDHRHAGMYSQGLATLTLCESYALTREEKLQSMALSAIAFIIESQDPINGGWRYEPREAGDTSVVGWQVMALKSAQNAGLSVNPKAFRGAERFLNTVQTEGGSKYGYTDTTDIRPATTAAGLLCRMYLGWDRNKGGLKRGVIYLDKTRPARNDMYYNYYATQVLHHWGGEEWTRWNDALREQLVATQHGPDRGHSAGSWDLADPHGSAGGRHYMTCLCVMTLEVYYRHLPLYQREKIKVQY